MTVTQQEDDSAVTPSNLPKFGQNKYKVAAAAQNKRMQNIKDTLQEMLSLQKEAKAEMTKFKAFQEDTIKTVQSIMVAVEDQGTEAKKNQKITDDRLMQVRQLLALFNNMMNFPKQQSELLRQKMPRPLLPPEEDNITIAKDSEDSEGDQDYDNNNTNKNAPKSDDKMKVVAGGN